MDRLKDMLAGLAHYGSPARIFLIIAISIFGVEMLIMGALVLLSPETPLYLAMLDAVVLIVLLSPILYFFLLRPLVGLTREKEASVKSLQSAMDRAQRYLDVAGVIIVVLDREGRVTLINRKGAEILGYAEKEITGRDWFGFLPARIRDEVMHVFTSLISGSEDAEGYFENPVLSKDGNERVILWHNTILREDGAIVGTLSSGEDITERKRTEKALKESEIKYRLLHNTAFDAIIISNERDAVIECNPSAERTFGYRKGEMIGMPVTRLMPEKFRARHIEKFAQFLSTGVSTVMGKVLEMEGLRKNGDVFPIEIVLNTFTIAGERYFTGMIRDITERKRAEREKELIQARLNQSQKMEAIGRFSGGIAHDFNNILSAIRGNAELAMEEMNKTDPLYQRLDSIILSVMLASKLTRQLLLFSRSQPFELVPLNINKTIEDLLVMISRLIGEEIIVSTDLAPGLWTVEADEGTIEQVVMNLAVNARDAMPQGGTLSIGTRNMTVEERQCEGIPECRPGDVVCLTVSDNGVGMEKDLLHRIFEPFFTTKEAGKGTGFGLSVVYSIVKQHGGWITVQSEPGAGTTFNIYLPALRQRLSSALPGIEKKNGLGEKVLLVAGDEDLFEYAKAGLGGHGYAVYGARGAGEAVKIFNELEGAVSVLLCDSLLRDQSGLALAEHLRGRKPGIGVVLMGAREDEDMKAEATSKKFAYIPKPFSMNALLSAVKETAEHARMKR